MRVVFLVGLVVLVLVILIVLFLKLWPAFGGHPSNEDWEDYEDRAYNFKDGVFYNENSYQMIYDENEENEYLSDKWIKPVDKIPTMTPTYVEKPSKEMLTVTWFGHSTLLLQIQGMNILIDPVFSDVASPVSFVGPKRYSELPIEADELPKIDIVVISHDHYDHLDYKTIREIDEKVVMYVVPLGIENHLERWGVDSDKIINLAWWEEVEIEDLTIGCTPARHYSGRGLNDRYNTLWASWVFIGEHHKVFESGDSGFDEHFEEIYDRYGEFDLAMLDAGQYNVRWKSTHMTPEEAVEAGKIIDANVIMPIHWGAFVLSEHPWDDPVKRFTKKAYQEGIDCITPMIGETVTFSEEMQAVKWWIDID